MSNTQMQAVAPVAAGGAAGRNALTALTEQLGMSDTAETYAILKNTIMPGARDEELAAFALVCSVHKLNPLTREVYAFPTKGGGIMPMIGIDGWLKLAHQHADYAGMSWTEGSDGSDKWCECTVYLRSTPEHPVTIREYLSECKQPGPVWAQRPRRMLRHRATIQAIRYALGIAGVMDSDEAGEMAMPGSMQMRTVSAQSAPVVQEVQPVRKRMPRAAETFSSLESVAAKPVQASGEGVMASGEQVLIVDEEANGPAEGSASLPAVPGAFERLMQGVRQAGKGFPELRRWLHEHDLGCPVGASREASDAWATNLLADERTCRALVDSGMMVEQLV
ncbi:MAG: RecT family recombinase [Akkermansia sp.]